MATRDSRYDQGDRRRKRRTSSSRQEETSSRRREAAPSRENKVVRGRPPETSYARTNYSSNTSHSRAKPQKKKKVKRVLITLGVILVLLIGIVVFGFNYMFGNLKRSEISNNIDDLGITSERLTQSNNEIVNIALFGLDTREDNDTGRSDAIIIATVDKRHKDIKLTSIARDTYVSVEGHGDTKLAHAYAYGGAELAVKTLNQNFDMDISDYVTVNFFQLADVIDVVGGVDIELSEAERVSANHSLNEVEPNAKPISATGMVHLDGKQAVAYSRIRDVDSDDGRTQRQRNVLRQLFDKAKTTSVLDYPQLIRQGSKMVETSLDYGEIADLATIMLYKEVEMKEMSLPNAQSNAGGKTVNGTWYYAYDLDLASEHLRKFVYDDIVTE